MELSLEVAEYIICLQSYKNAEIGLDADDLKIRDIIERSFPQILEERERNEMNTWLWGKLVERNEAVKEARKHLYEGPADCYTFRSGSFQQLKRKVEAELLSKDKRGEINLIALWKAEKNFSEGGTSESKAT